MLHAGAAKVDITPPVGIDLAGYGLRAEGGYGATGVNDPLWVRALALEQDGACFVMLVFDLLGVQMDTTARIRSLLCRRIPVANVQIMVCATHNHCAPTLFVETPGTTVDEAWCERTIAAAVEAGVAAYRALRPARMSTGSTIVEGVGANRKAWLDDGSLFHHIGRSARVPPAGRTVVKVGPVDPELSVLGLQAPDGDWIAALVNYACHPWLYNSSRISSEIPGACVDYLEARLGRPDRPMIALYAAGAGSDITTIQHQEPIPEDVEAKVRWFVSERLRFGAILGEAALRAIAGAEPCPDPAPLVSQSLPFACPIHDGPLGEVRQPDGTLPSPPLVRDMEVQVATFGESAAMVGLPCEVYVDIGLAIKGRSRFAKTMVISQANDYFADIITHQAVAEGVCPELTWTQVDPLAGDIIMNMLVAPVFGEHRRSEVAAHRPEEP